MYPLIYIDSDNIFIKLITTEQIKSLSQGPPMTAWWCHLEIFRSVVQSPS